MTYDPNEATVAKMVRCQHEKKICAPCAHLLAVDAYAEGQSVMRERVVAVITAMRTERDSIAARDAFDRLLAILP